MSATHTTHEQSRQRNQKFAEFIKSEEVQQQMKSMNKSKCLGFLRDSFKENMNKSKCLGFLRDSFKEKYNVTIPASAAYKVIASVDDRFKPKQRVQTPKATWAATPAESIDNVLNEKIE